MNTAFLTMAGVSFLAALAGPARWWRRGRPGARLIFIVLVMFGLSFLSLSPVVAHWVGHAIPGEANAGVLSRELTGMVLAWLVQMLMLTAAYKPDERATRTRWRTILLVAVMVSISAVFLVQFADKPYVADYWEAYGRGGLWAVYVVIYEGYFLVTLWDIIALTLRAARIAARPSVRVGMRLILIGACGGMVYILSVLAKLVYMHVRAGKSTQLTMTAEVALVFAGAFLIAGMLTPAAGIGVETAVQTPKRRRLLGRLGPLERVLGVPADVPLIPTQERVTARLVALRDAARELLPYFATGPQDADEQEVARLLAAAVQARRAGEPRQESHDEWRLPAWFAEPERIAIVADNLRSLAVTAVS